MARAPHSTTIHILMAVYNGARYLPEQLASFEGQDHTDWTLVASDDGSEDDSIEILKAFAARHPSTQILDGPGQGGAANFLFLLRHLAQTSPDAHWIAFADQDDKWLPHKLDRAMRWMTEVDPARPALYCSRSLIATPDLRATRLSPPRPKPLAFCNALVQNVAAGNTIVLNPAAVQLVLRAADQVADVVVHDWWIYQLVTGAGGKTLHDDKPALLYRQHEANQIGANDSWRARVRRIGMLLRGDFRDWNHVNIAALKATEDALTPDNRLILKEFDRARRLSLIPRLWALRRLGLYRQTRADSIALWIAAVLRRI